jgi:hypothetical protein
MMFDFKNTSIPFVLVQSSVYGCDCIGLGIIYLKSQGFLCSWEKNVIRKIHTYDVFKQYMDKCGFIKDIDGDFFLERSFKSGHIGIIINNSYVFQSNITLKTEYRDIPKNGYRYKYTGN